MDTSINSQSVVCTLRELISLEGAVELEEAVQGAKYCLSMEDFTEQYVVSYVPVANMSSSSYLVQHEIVKPCLLATVTTDGIRVARVNDLDALDSPLMVDRIPFFAFNVKNHNLVSEDYLLRTLVSSEVESQVLPLCNFFETAHSIGEIISVDALLDVKIDLPKLEVQDFLTKKDMLSLLNALMSEKQAALEDYKKDTHMKKHAVGQTLFNLNNWWNTLQKARKEGNGVLRDDAQTGKIRPIPVGEIYNRIGETLNILSNQINTFTIGDGMEPQNIPLAHFIEDYIANHRSPMFEYMFDTNGCFATDEFKIKGKTVLHRGDALLYLSFPKEALTQIFDNIVSNACSHGFLGVEDKDNRIRIEFSVSGSVCTVVVANNGKPLLKGMSEEKVFAYGESSAVGVNGHNGLGAFQIKNLMARFGGTASILSDETADFPFAYKLVFQNCISYY